jgi:hypothetical protein
MFQNESSRFVAYKDTTQVLEVDNHDAKIQNI